jgi:hypothetical protein
MSARSTGQLEHLCPVGIAGRRHHPAGDLQLFRNIGGFLVMIILALIIYITVSTARMTFAQLKRVLWRYKSDRHFESRAGKL